MTVLCTRLELQVRSNGLLQGANSAGLKLHSTGDGITLVAAAIESANIEDRELILLSQDIRRAFDSVPWHSLKLAMRRIGLPEKFIQLQMHIFERHRAHTKTAYGYTTWFHQELSVSQGDIPSPLLWVLFFFFGFDLGERSPFFINPGTHIATVYTC